MFRSEALDRFRLRRDLVPLKEKGRDDSLDDMRFLGSFRIASEQEVVVSSFVEEGLAQ